MDDRDVDELQRIWELKQKGAISDDEYARLKARILRQETEHATDSSSEARTAQSVSAIPGTGQNQQTPRNAWKNVGIGCLAFFGLIFILGIIGSTTKPGGSTSANQVTDPDVTNTATVGNATETSKKAVEAEDSPWSYSQDEDKVRGGTTYYARTTSTNSIAQSFPYDSDTTMGLTVRKSPAYGTDVILTISSGQMMCPSYEGCSGTVRFDDGPAQRVSFNGPADDSSDTVFVVGAKQFIAKLKAAKKVTIEKTLYEAGNPQFEFDVHGLRWDH